MLHSRGRFTVTYTREADSAGMVPVKLFPDASSSVSRVNADRPDGRVPVRLFPSKSRYLELSWEGREDNRTSLH